MKQEYEFKQGKRGRFFRESAKLRLPDSSGQRSWAGAEEPLGKFIVKEAGNTLASYQAQPRRIVEDANGEHFTATGGYAHRQLFELIQNSADALFGAPEGQSILIRLTDEFLYCADNGEPIDREGVTALMFSHMSPKHAPGHIGRFGLGFKSVLAVSDIPEFFSQSGSFRFDGIRAAERIREAELNAGTAHAERYPVLRLPEPADPNEASASDEDLQELMTWATNIVRLPLKTGVHSDLSRQIRNFPPEFMLFVDHVRYLTLEDGEASRAFLLHRADEELRLDTGKETTRWRRFDVTHPLSEAARSDWPLRDKATDVTVSWAAPLDRLDGPGHFWAFFPTSTASLVAGILNAPWKTNEDRQNLLPGPYNEELIDAAAEMLAEALPSLATSDDPARHLDALPRRHEAGDSEHSDYLRDKLFSCLRDRKIMPDQDGVLRHVDKVSFPPKKLTDLADAAPFDVWGAYADRPRDWLHHQALKRNRLAAIDRLSPRNEHRYGQRAATRSEIAEWLRALVENAADDKAVQGSMAAIRTAAAIPSEIRSGEHLGLIVLAANGVWRLPDPECLFLPDDAIESSDAKDAGQFVHPELVSDDVTLAALKELGFKTLSSERRFRYIAQRVLASGTKVTPAEHEMFWRTARALSLEASVEIIKEFSFRNEELWRRNLRVLTLSGDWKPHYSVLLPGEIVPDDESRDGSVAVDTNFHKPDTKLLRTLGVTDLPHHGCDLAAEPWFETYLNDCRKTFKKRSLESNPHSHRLVFENSIGCGPLNVLRVLSEEGKAAYTDAVLSLDAAFSCWTMRHDTQREKYLDLVCYPPTRMLLRDFGRIKIPSGQIVPLMDAVGSPPNSAEALHTLLSHPNADRIKRTFALADPIPEVFGESDPVPLTDVWPGLKEHLPTRHRNCQLVTCERILVMGQPQTCVFRDPDVCLTGTVEDDESGNLELIADALGLNSWFLPIDAILERRTPVEVQERRTDIHKCSTHAERLLLAIGQMELREGLPDSLLGVLEKDGTSLKGTDIADAAIATYHTDALRQYKWALEHLDPPSKWAGSRPAVEFVHSLGFPTQWAGERAGTRDPFVDVQGPHSLPPLHEYQRTIVDNIRALLRREHEHDAGRRGMVSMPTGSGKTRVAVQAIVEAMREDDFDGGVLWVADRDELCEQAVESWRQVWASVGAEATPLRISRMWAGQPPPMPRIDRHVVVATVQTLNARLDRQMNKYGFLADFKLVVFDEAHGSIAPTYTSVMSEIGLTRYQRPDEPFMLGLTATPYRGHDEDETARLVARYGNRRLDTGAFASDQPELVVQDLQSMGVLAQADHETIEGASFQLDAILEGEFEQDEWENKLDEWSELPWLPQSVEDRIAQSAERTVRIIEAYNTHIDPDWPTLVFATSVEHAKTVAALLSRSGITSRSVSGETDSGTRRRIVEEFRRGKVKALVNYGVFREGFDAPKTRAIIVARPVYSPNLYFQMIGRGLRGPMNGGDERCLILNVQDNIENYDRALAFSELDWLWA